MGSDTPRLQPLNEDRDAARWAREFNESLKRFYPGNCQPPLDEGWLIGWFANAMMCGEDTYRWRREAEARTARSETQEFVIDTMAGKLTTFDAICGYISELEMKVHQSAIGPTLHVLTKCDSCGAELSRAQSAGTLK